MNDSQSPLRYPGGKASIIGMLIETLNFNNLQLYRYAEPFAGGCGLALGLLMRGYVTHIHINDIDKGIWAFWHSILNHTEKFIEKMYSVRVTIDEWYIQREIIRNPNNYSIFELGFATFFLNRTNRSGILTGGVIGGLKQNGSYLLDCRFNKQKLEQRIRRIGLYSNKIHLTNLDALRFLDLMSESPFRTFICIDPPYFKKGSSLYTNFYNPEDHKVLANKISKLKMPWILTYDNEIEIRNLYSTFRKIEFNLNYSLQCKRQGTEIMMFSDNLDIPQKYIGLKLNNNIINNF